MRYILLPIISAASGFYFLQDYSGPTSIGLALLKIPAGLFFLMMFGAFVYLYASISVVVGNTIRKYFTHKTSEYTQIDIDNWEDSNINPWTLFYCVYGMPFLISLSPLLRFTFEDGNLEVYIAYVIIVLNIIMYTLFVINYRNHADGQIALRNIIVPYIAATSMVSIIYLYLADFGFSILYAYTGWLYELEFEYPSMIHVVDFGALLNACFWNTCISLIIIWIATAIILKDWKRLIYYALVLAGPLLADVAFNWISKYEIIINSNVPYFSLAVVSAFLLIFVNVAINVLSKNVAVNNRCSNCNSVILLNDNYCSECGNTVEKESAHGS